MYKYRVKDIELCHHEVHVIVETGGGSWLDVLIKHMARRTRHLITHSACLTQEMTPAVII
jgi:hypothetical protein